ncbi:hypothetical protein V498_05446 [Pseudogymnoascus sp. VKM F-4517 (FW-2822)]|nr:hypothetical protein V498_05446 [Pseudogymnoascus sp. VKM F-4517 (FW-2822)]
MVTARVPALGLYVRDITVLCHHRLNKLRQRRVDEISDHAHALRLSGIESLLYVTSHILLQHGPHVTAFLLIRAENGLGAEQAALLGRVPVKLDGIRCVPLHDGLVSQQHPQRFEDRDRS